MIKLIVGSSRQIRARAECWRVAVFERECMNERLPGQVAVIGFMNLVDLVDIVRGGHERTEATRLCATIHCPMFACQEAPLTCASFEGECLGYSRTMP
jgi:hypothetical protein